MKLLCLALAASLSACASAATLSSVPVTEPALIATPSPVETPATPFKRASAALDLATASYVRWRTWSIVVVSYLPTVW